MPPIPTSIPISTPSRTYEALVGPDLLAGAAIRIGAALHGTRSIHIFADDGLPPAVLGDLSRRLDASGFKVSSSPVRATEDGKTLQSLYHMLQQLATNNLERRDAVIALGGGITGDMAGFAASSYRRGIPWINCPTTLLAMVDAAVGGKTGVNLRSGKDLQKNMVGAFWQPSLVLADVSTLTSLDDRTFRAGLAECIKHAMLSFPFGDEHLMTWTKEKLPLIHDRDPETLTELIARNIAIKSKVVGTDEREESTATPHPPNGGRALLNLGHTFAHAIETLPMVSPGLVGIGVSGDSSLTPLQHGEAVALGLICAAKCAELLKLVGDGLTDSIRHTLRHAMLPTLAYHLPGSGEVFERMTHDKKVARGKLHLILPCGEAKCQVVVAPPEAVVHQAIDAIRP